MGIPQHTPYASVPIFVVMPDHIHLVVFIDDVDGKMGFPVVTVPPVVVGGGIVVHVNRWKSATVDQQMQLISRRKHRLSCVIGNFKSAVTKYAHEKNVPFVWQTRFHDHIIRNAAELNRIVRYVDNNVANWDS